MFKLMKDRRDAINDAYEFVVDEMPGGSTDTGTISRIISVHVKFPCLMEWFIRPDCRGNSVLDYNKISKTDAKCLVYPNTNKSTYLFQIILRSDVDIQRAIKESKFIPDGWKRAKIIKVSWFDKVLEARETSDEPFFVKIRLIRSDNGTNDYMRISIINLNMARQLVYYAKNNKHSLRAARGGGAVEYSEEVAAGVFGQIDPSADTGPEDEAEEPATYEIVQESTSDGLQWG